MRDLACGRQDRGRIVLTRTREATGISTCPVEVAECATERAASSVGIDLGLHTTGDTIDRRKNRSAAASIVKSEAKLATAQRARKTPQRVRNIHAKIANRRRDFLHKATAKIAKEFGLIVIGDVSPSKTRSDQHGKERARCRMVATSRACCRGQVRIRHAAA